MMSDNQTADFLFLLYRFLKANPACIVAVSDGWKQSSDKLLIGYYDDVYYYIRPQMILPVFRAEVYGSYKVDVQKILRELFAMDLIKVHWILTGELRYRPQKRIGKTRKRFITINRKRFEKFISMRFQSEPRAVKEAGNESD